MTLHFWLGYAVIALLVFRLVWGFVGPAPARFTHFIRGPRAVLGYAREMVRSRPSHWPGHSPVGALAVVAKLAALGLQAPGQEWLGLCGHCPLRPSLHCPQP